MTRSEQAAADLRDVCARRYQAIRTAGAKLAEAIVHMGSETDLLAVMRGTGSLIIALEELGAHTQDAVGSLRARLAEAMAETDDTRSVYSPTHVFTASRTPKRVEVTQPDLLPKQYWVTPAPRPDLTAIGKALREKALVPGATLVGNQAPTLRITARKDKQ